MHSNGKISVGKSMMFFYPKDQKRMRAHTLCIDSYEKFAMSMQFDFCVYIFESESNENSNISQSLLLMNNECYGSVSCYTVHANNKNLNRINSSTAGNGGGGSMQWFQFNSFDWIIQLNILFLHLFPFTFTFVRCFRAALGGLYTDCEL